MKNANKFLGIAFVGGLLVSGISAASAQDDEKAMLKQCELSLCELIVKKSTDGGNIACDLKKTWGKKDLEEGAKATKLKWSWGDAKCETKVDLERGPLVAALTEASYDLKVPAVPVTCTIGGGEKSEVKFTLAPSLKFEGGEAKKVSLGLDGIEGSFMKKMALKAAQLVDKSHAFDGLLAKEVNKFITKKCPEQVK